MFYSFSIVFEVLEVHLKVWFAVNVSFWFAFLEFAFHIEHFFLNAFLGLKVGIRKHKRCFILIIFT